MTRLISQRTVRVSNAAGQSRVMRWADLCFCFIGAKNAKTIERIDRELTENGSSMWCDATGNDITLKTEEWWPREEGSK